MESDLTEIQIIEASHALARWFESQRIAPADASLVMLQLHAALLGDKTRDIGALSRAVELIRAMLLMDIATLLKDDKQ